MRFWAVTIIGLLFFFVFASTAAAGQWTVGPSLTVIGFDSGGLDDFIAPYDLPGYEGALWAPGLSGMVLTRRFYLAPTVYFSRMSRKRHSNSAWLYYAWAMFDVGYDLVDDAYWTLAPFAGVGYAYTEISLDVKQSAPVDHVGRASIPVEAGLALVFRYFATPRLLTSVTLRAGYSQYLSLGDWTENGEKAAAQPDFTLSGVFFRCELGLGSTW